ncbi:E3 ubiquitin ligase complex SCF subunit sconC [Piptocephalis cylindrospora]|uniref:E3 ubiquitin ligase complex SCF subunit n=1 Tax=Piptocephalis cylindrospora TaxID=1907219 RepID=A0A4P9Y502_9FUNG|nr:E3 ubiquitin ligase complex SCF subunit sconC [Piptocephalis cylindrospora]|eukprot:RKP14078.1 E3 ubiquitin ligase complex SCF subunit sconC [Piptocephalis cylindrospora]
MVKLTSSDNQTFEVERKVAERSILTKNLLEDVGGYDQAIPLPNVTGPVLKRVLEYCEHHKDDAAVDAEEAEDDYSQPRVNEEIEPWDRDFIGSKQEVIFELILAANYLDIRSLLELGCKVIASQIKGKTPEQIRETFGIVNDFTPEEEERVKRENAWGEDS